MKKPRNKKYRPKYVARNVLSTIFGGMSGDHAEHLRTIQIRNHRALAEMAQGRGTREQWDELVGAANMANVMCEQGIGNEYRAITIAARDALLEVGKRIVKTERVILKGDELNAIREGLLCHDAQLENVRAIDVERACREVERRVRHRINSTSVHREIALETA
ncbi:hypothetical protein QPK31_23335 [Massilia sp. YIM B02769]|uniref:hypothetical protein n=1 Tax=Massilia sp. YIM B02769 TaxID=3050129 RepID=UPI0025B6778D|nr:hypothetical protein [Massilia sp. YIM B02769]MDN4061157.1 hypothetical protein [Massilia sp. YIM B02769]